MILLPRAMSQLLFTRHSHTDYKIFTSYNYLAVGEILGVFLVVILLFCSSTKNVVGTQDIPFIDTCTGISAPGHSHMTTSAYLVSPGTLC